MCGVVPAAGAVITSVIWVRTKSVEAWWLSLLFWGGALFGFVDHLWNGEPFLISENIISDLMLGLAISSCIIVLWGAAVVTSKGNPTLARYRKV